MSPPDVPAKVTFVLGAQRAVGAGEGRDPSVGPHVNIKRASVIVRLGAQRAPEVFAGLR